MSDDPHAPENRGEASFMLAAETAIKELQSQATEAKTAAESAKNAADRAEKSARRWKKLTLVLAFFIALSLVVGGVSGYYVNQTRNQADGLRQQTIASCEARNQQQAQFNQLLTRQFAGSNRVTETAFSEFINVLEGKHPTPEIVAIANGLEARIKHSADTTYATFKTNLDKATQHRDCQQAYTASNSAAPSSLSTMYATAGQAVSVG